MQSWELELILAPGVGDYHATTDITELQEQGTWKQAGRAARKSVRDIERTQKRLLECDSSKGNCSWGLKENEEDIMEAEGKKTFGAE